MPDTIKKVNYDNPIIKKNYINEKKDAADLSINKIESNSLKTENYDFNNYGNTKGKEIEMPKTYNYTSTTEEKSHEAGEQIYKRIVELGCTHVLFKDQEARGQVTNSYANMQRLKEINCSAAVSIYLQKIGCLDEGKVIKHTPPKQGGTSIDDSLIGTENLKNCKVVWLDAKYEDLPEEYKKAGIVYIQDSNACLSAGDGKIWSVNSGAGYKNDHYNKYDRGVLTSKEQNTYPFTNNIKVAIIPNGI